MERMTNRRVIAISVVSCTVANANTEIQIGMLSDMLLEVTERITLGDTGSNRRIEILTAFYYGIPFRFINK